MSAILELKNLHKTFDATSVLRGVDLTLEKGVVLGLLGVNGAGKTTLIKCALGLLKPSAGEAGVFGEASWDMSPEAKEKIGYVPQTLDAFHWMTVEQLVKYTGAFYSRWNPEKANNLMFQWDLHPTTRVAKLSEGQKQRLSIILALGHDPDLLILDEPVASLDPQARRNFIHQLIELNADAEKTVLFSTHIISDVERVAADIAILKDGRIAYHGDLDTLKEEYFRIHVLSEQVLPVGLEIPNALHVDVNGRTARAMVRGLSTSDLVALGRHLNVKIEKEPLGLEDIFLEVNR